MGFRALKGTKDIFGDEMRKWLEVEEIIRNLCDDFSFNQIRTPIIEETGLFQRGVGDTTDIVNKEMYSFTLHGNDISLKPESTAAVARAFMEHSMYADTQPTKLYYISPTFRYERPQAGRQRQFHQFGIEMFGTDSPTADAEVISIGYTMLKRLGINKVELHINSLGCAECRKKYNETLKAFLNERKEHLCPLCQERMEKNPLRVLDCKNEECQKQLKDVPTVLSTLDEECTNHFNQVQALLKAMNIPFIVDTGIVRGLDYYTRTVFEFVSNDIGAQGTVCGGGRYDGLLDEIGGKHVPAVGFGAGMERLILVRDAENGSEMAPAQKDIFIGYRGEEAMLEAIKLVYNLRQKGISAETDHLQRSIKAQMKYANKINAKYSCIIGESELQEGSLKLKEMESGDEVTVPMEQFVEVFHNMIEA